MAIISLNNISKNFGDKIIFNNFNLNIENGEFVTIMGASGSGKSTLLNMIGLLEKQNSGDIIIKKSLNPNLNSREGILLLRNDISYLFQNYGLIESKTVYYNLKIATRFLNYNKNTEKEKIRTALSKVGLENIETKKVYTLSGGEQQRVALAKILLKSSTIILADEPTGSLDYKNRDIVLNLLKKLNDTGKTIVVVTHDPNVEKFATRKIQI